jgi:hypothetical protein
MGIEKKGPEERHVGKEAEPVVRTPLNSFVPTAL